MKATGIVRRLDSLGRIVIPKEIRRTHGIEADDPIEIFTEDDKIILRKYQRGCTLCGSMDNLIDVDGVAICRKCAGEIAEALEDIGNGAT